MAPRIVVTIDLDEANQIAAAAIHDDGMREARPVWIARTPGLPTDEWEVRGRSPVLPGRDRAWADARHAYAVTVADRRIEAVGEER